MTHARHVFATAIAIGCLLVPVGVAQTPAGGKPALPKSAAPGKAPTSTRPAPTDAAAVMADVCATLAAAPVWSYRCKWGAGAVGTVGIGADTEQFVRHDPAGRATGLRITGTFGPSGPKFDAGGDEDRVTVVDLGVKTWEEMPWSARALMAAGPPSARGKDSMMVRWTMPIQFYQPKEMAPTVKDTLSLAGTQVLDNVLCDVVTFERPLEIHRQGDPPAGAPAPANKEVTEYVIGRDDHLPRRTTRRSVGSGGGGAMSASNSYLLTQWNLNPAVTDATFVVVTNGCQPGPFIIPKGSSGGRHGGPATDGPSVGVKVGDVPPDFTLKDTTGKETKSSIYKGRVALIHFSTLEGDAGDVLLTRMKAKHGDKLVVLDLVVDHTNGGVNAVKKAKKAATFQRLVGGESVADAWAVNQFPIGIVIGPDGRVATTLITGIASGAVSPETVADMFVKKMGEYLKKPEKGW